MTHLTRRRAICLMALFPAVAAAHGGHDKARVRVEAKVLKTKGNIIRVKFTILNLASQPLVLETVTAEGAKTVSPFGPVNIGGFEAADVKVELVFHNAMPENFTANLGFSGGGHSSVPVST